MKFKLIGCCNITGNIPGFAYPIFSDDGEKLFFQYCENGKITTFELINKEYFFSNNTIIEFSCNIECNINDSEIYCFIFNSEKIIYGNKNCVQSKIAELLVIIEHMHDKILSKQIEKFMEDYKKPTVTVAVFDMKGKTVGTMVLDASLFGLDPNKQESVHTAWNKDSYKSVNISGKQIYSNKILKRSTKIVAKKTSGIKIASNPAKTMMKSVIPSNRKTGIVKWYNPDKGIGLIGLKENGDEFNVHFSDLSIEGAKTLKIGDNISFYEYGYRNRKPNAKLKSAPDAR